MKINVYFKKILLVLFLIAAIILMTVRCFYGINFDDELAYISVVKRMMQGEWIILQDWNTPTILSSWLTYQLLRLTGIFKMEAYVLGFRLIYIVFQCLVAGTLFIWLKRTKWSLAAILVYLFATPYNIYTLSYNTLSIGFMILVCAFIFTRTEWTQRRYIICGLLFSLCVLSNPFVILLYFIYFICTVFCTARKSSCHSLLTVKGFLAVTAGAFGIFVLFMVSMLRQGSIAEYFQNAVLLLNDAEHGSSGNIFMQIGRAIYQLVRVYWRISIPMMIITGLTLFRKKENKYGKVLMLCAIAVTAYGIIRFSFIYGSVYPNLMLVSLNFIGIETYLLTENKNKPLFYGWYLVGLLYAICIYIGTNTGILSGSAAFVVPSVACVLLLLDYAEEQTYKGFTYALVILEIGCILWLRLTYVWADGKLDELAYRIEEGPCKYLYTSKESYERYQQTLELVFHANISTEDSVLFMPMEPLPYLVSKGRYATPYTKRFKANLTELKNYYGQNPNMLPDIVIANADCEPEEWEEILKVLACFEQEGYRREAEDSGFIKIVR